MNPTQILNLQGFEYIQKIEKLIRVSLGRNRARPSCTARARPTASRVWPAFTALARPTATRAQPNSASAGAARAAAQCMMAALHGYLTTAPSLAHRRWPGKRGGAHRSVDDGAARRRRRQRRVARRAWTSAARRRPAASYGDG
jgi:hypothetical protein